MKYGRTGNHRQVQPLERFERIDDLGGQDPAGGWRLYYRREQVKATVDGTAAGGQPSRGEDGRGTGTGGRLPGRVERVLEDLARRQERLRVHGGTVDEHKTAAVNLD